jgi:hypothetical protein
MKPIKVILENIPKAKKWYFEWTPIFIAVFALIVSILALNWSQEQFTNSSRPFVWIIDFSVLNEKQQIINQPQTVAVRVINAPAKIMKEQYQYYFIAGSQKRDIDNNEKKDFVRFPDEKSQYTYTVGAFEQALTTRKSGEELKRYVRVDYSGLSGGKEYMYESYSTYDFIENRWQVESETAR